MQTQRTVLLLRVEHNRNKTRSPHLISGDDFRQVGFEIKTDLRYVPTKDNACLLRSPCAYLVAWVKQGRRIYLPFPLREHPLLSKYPRLSMSFTFCR